MSGTALKDYGNMIKTAVWAFIEDECMAMAAALAYYTALSLPPMLGIIVTVSGWIWKPDQVIGQVEQQVSSVVGEGAWQQIETMMQAANQRDSGSTFATMFGVGILLFTATGVMVQLQAALNKAWQVEPDPEGSTVKEFIMKRIMSLAMVLGIAFLLLVSLVLTAVLNAASGWVTSWLPDNLSVWIPQAVNVTVTFVIVTLLFAAMFKWFPDAVISWKDTWFGAAITALLFMIGQFGLGFYFSVSDAGMYGVATSFVLLLIWVYYSSIIVLLGAEFTQVWARQRGSRIVPEKGAVRVVRQKEHVRSGQKAPGMG